MSTDLTKYRRVTFIDDISPITSDILNDFQLTAFNAFENVGLYVDRNDRAKMMLRAGKDGYDSSSSNPIGVVQSDGRVRLVDGSVSGVVAGVPLDKIYIKLDAGDDDYVYTNTNYNVSLIADTSESIGKNQRLIGESELDRDDGYFENTKMIAGAIARADQFNAFTFQSIDGNSTPLTIEGINEDKPNLVVDAEITFKLHDDPDLAAEGHIMVDTAKGGIKTELIVAPDPNSTDPLAPSDPTVIIGHNVHVPGDITVDGQLIFDQSVLGTLGATPWQQLDSAAEVQEFADSTFDGLLPNPSHAPVNFYPLGTIVEWAIPHNFDIDSPQTWPIGWIPATVNLAYNMDDDCTRAWLTPLYQHLEGPASTPSGTWTMPGSSDYALTDHEPFIFLGSMSYTIDNGHGPILSPDMQGYGHKFGEIEFTNPLNP